VPRWIFLLTFFPGKRKKPLMRCCEKRARLPLTRGRAVVVRRYPLTIRLKDRVGAEVRPVRVKLDPGSKTTGIAIVTDEDGNKPAEVLCLIELCHRGWQISKAVTVRALQRRRRGANLRAGGSFRVGNADGISAEYCKRLNCVDGYGCQRLLPTPEGRGFPRGGF
jgi:RRXRR protein